MVTVSLTKNQMYFIVYNLRDLKVDGAAVRDLIIVYEKFIKAISSRREKNFFKQDLESFKDTNNVIDNKVYQERKK